MKGNFDRQSDLIKFRNPRPLGLRFVDPTARRVWSESISYAWAYYPYENSIDFCKYFLLTFQPCFDMFIHINQESNKKGRFSSACLFDKVI
jgi:hypothetical protein